MNKVILYIGLNVNQLTFQQGGNEPGLYDGKMIINAVRDTFRVTPEAGLHARIFGDKFIGDLNYSLPYWNIHISTNSDIPINILGELIRTGKISTEDVVINVMNSDNTKIERVSGFDPEGYLFNWPFGFLEYDYDVAKQFNVEDSK